MLILILHHFQNLPLHELNCMNTFALTEIIQHLKCVKLMKAEWVKRDNVK